MFDKNSIQVVLTWLLDWVQYFLFGGNLMQHSRYVSALALAGFHAPHHQFHFKMIGRLHQVLEFLNINTLGMDFLRKLFFHRMRSSDIDETSVRAGSIQSTAAIFSTFFFLLKLCDCCILGLQLLDRQRSYSKAVCNGHAYLMFVQKLKIKAPALDQLYHGDVNTSRDSMIRADYLESLSLLGLLCVCTLTLTCRIEYVVFSYMIKVWDPRWKRCLDSCTSLKRRKSKRRLYLAINLDGIMQSIWSPVPLNYKSYVATLICNYHASQQVENEEFVTRGLLCICFTLLILGEAHRSLRQQGKLALHILCSLGIVEYVKVDQLVHDFIGVLGVILPCLFGRIVNVVFAVYVCKIETHIFIDDWALFQLQLSQFARLQ